MRRSDLRNIIREVLIDVVQEMSLREDTTLRSLVAKADSEQLANQAVLHLKKRGIEARAADESTFGLNRDESEGWGVFVEPGIVNKAAKALASVSKGLEFDPYTRTSGGD